MRKYLHLFGVSWSNQLVYRFNVLFWRMRQFLSAVLALTVWQTIYTQTNTIQSYSAADMFSYVFLASILQSTILATPLHGIANHVWSGGLSNELVKPVNIYAYFAVQDIADKLRNIGFIVGESLLLYWLFQPTLLVPNLQTAIIFILWSLAAAVLYFWINLAFGALGFYSPQTWGPKFLFFVIVDVTAGKLFPLDILPEPVQTVLSFTPFPYLGFFQTQLFLGRLDASEIMHHSLVLLFFCVATALAVVKIWGRSLKHYTAVGR